MTKEFSQSQGGVMNLDDAVAWRKGLADDGKRLVLTNGCFDLIHAGHTRYLAEARELGDMLVVALNDDDSVRALKGEGRPLNNQDDRAEVMAALRMVDGVVVFSGDRATSVIEALKPDVYAKGGDYTVDSLNPEERSSLEECGAQIEILSLVPGRSTSSTVRKMRDADTDSRKLRIGVLASGSGSNMQAIQDAIEAGELNAEIVMILSDVEDAKVHQRAKDAGLPCRYVDPGPFKTKLGEAAQKEIRDRLLAAGVDLICLAGFMRMVKPPLLDSFEGRIINIHPSLLPDFKGLAAWKQALEAGVPEAGCTVHFVDSGMDTGAIIDRERVSVLPNDTAESLHARIQEKEHILYPRAIRSLIPQLLGN